MSLTRTKFTKEEKLAIVKEFAQSKMTKCKFVAQHPEYKRTTLFSWLKLYFSESTGEAADAGITRIDSIGKFNFVVDTAKMSDEELGVYCRSNGIYSTDLKSWKLNCMNANDKSTEALEKELCKLRSEVKQLREKDSRQAAELKKNEKELNRMKDALAEYAVKEAFLKKVQAYFGKNDGEQ